MTIFNIKHFRADEWLEDEAGEERGSVRFKYGHYQYFNHYLASFMNISGF